MTGNKSFLGEIDDLLNHQLILFCGAGISVNSGIPLSKTLISEIINKLSSKTFAKRFKKAIEELPLEMLLGTIKENSEFSKVLNVFMNSHPNMNHIMVSELAKRRIVKTIVTTNFDTLIEQSLKKSGLILDKDYLVFSDEQDFKNYSRNGLDDIINIIKIHGTIEKPDSIRTTMKQIANSLLSERRMRLIKSVFNDPTAVILVIGYSFTDNFDINPALLSIEKPKSRITVIQHLEHDTGKRRKAGTGYENAVSRILKNFDYDIISADTDVITDHILQKLEISTDLTAALYPESNWKKYIASWSLTLSDPERAFIELELSRVTTNLRLLKTYGRRLRRQLPRIKDENVLLPSLNLLSETFSSLKKFKEAEYYLEELGKFVESHGKHLEFEILTGMGNICSDKYELQLAKDWYSKAYKLSILIGEPTYSIIALKNLAYIEFEKGEHKSSLAFAHQASLLAERNGVQIEHNTYQDVGAAIFYTGSVEEAIQLREKALENASILGQKQVEGLNSISLSHLYLRKHIPPKVEDLEKSLTLAMNGLKISFEVCDLRMTSGAHLNIANANFFQCKFKNAFFHMTISYLQAISLNDPELIAGTIYNFGIYILNLFKFKNLNNRISTRVAKIALDKAFFISNKFGFDKRLEFYMKFVNDFEFLTK